MKRSFIYLAILTLVAVLIMVFTTGDPTRKSRSADNLLMPGVSKQINEVDRVEIISAGNINVATLLKKGDHWQLEQMGGYQADWPKLKGLLAALAQARVVETKTDKPEYYARLGVADIATENAGSVLVRMSIGEVVTGVLVGHRAEGRSGQYVRLQGEAASVLVDRNIEVSTELLDWADSTIIDINASEVAEVEIIHPDGQRVFVTRISADQTDFDYVGLPPGREAKSSWAVNSLGSVLSMLRMETVMQAQDVDWESAVRMRLLMFSGVEIMADMVEVEDQYLLRLKAGHPAANVVGSQVGDGAGSAEQQDIEKQAADDVAQTVTNINRKVDGWVYGISKSKYDVMVKKPEDILKPLANP